MRLLSVYIKKKPFDRIEWKYMYAIMHKMGIPGKIIEWTTILYQNPLVSINVNNHFTEPFRAERGIRQGCPLSPLLYALCAEGLSSLIRENDCIKGVDIISVRIKIIQHADDTSIIITGNDEFDVLQRILYTYSEGSGSKINYHKTTGLWLGAWKNDKLKILGIFLGNSVNPDENWNSQVCKVRYVLNRWKGRSLTLKGKMIAINSLVGSILGLLWVHLTMSRSCYQKFNDSIWDFFWSGKGEKLKRVTVRGPSRLGGLGVIDVDSKIKSLKLKWLQRYNPSSNSKWTKFLDFWINKAGSENNLGWCVFSIVKNPSTQVRRFSIES